MTDRPEIRIRSLAEEDEPHWRVLFRAYRDFYQLQESEHVVSRVWTWLTDPDHECVGLGGTIDGRLVGIAHYRRFSRPSIGESGIWLDDLFTDTAVRGRGVARALIERLRTIAADEGLSTVRWITAHDNQQAQALYDSLAVRTTWVIYDAMP